MILPSQAQSPLASRPMHSPVQGQQGLGYIASETPANISPNLYQEALGLLGPAQATLALIQPDAVQSSPTPRDNSSAVQNNNAIATHGGFTTLTQNLPGPQMPTHMQGHARMAGYTHQAPGYDVPVQRGLSTDEVTQAFIPDIQGVQAKVQGNFQVRHHTDFARPQMPGTQEMQGQGEQNLHVRNDTVSAMSQIFGPSLAWPGSSVTAQAQSQSQSQSPPFPVAGADGRLAIWALGGHGNGEPAQTLEEFMNSLLGIGGVE